MNNKCKCQQTIERKYLKIEQDTIACKCYDEETSHNTIEILPYIYLFNNMFLQEKLSSNDVEICLRILIIMNLLSRCKCNNTVCTR